jgi:DHA1 family multidrug resistance protein-like MFS transporter
VSWLNFTAGTKYEFRVESINSLPKFYTVESASLHVFVSGELTRLGCRHQADLSKASSHGGALGVLSSVMDIGHSTGPMVGGLLISALNYKSAFGIFGGIMAIASLAFGLIMRRISRSK